MLKYQKLVEEEVVSYFASLGQVYTPNSRFDNTLIDYFNSVHKLVEAFPRTVVQSDKVQSITLSAEFSKSLVYIENKIKRGVDITPHMGSGSLRVDFDDELLNDWRVHHLHLSHSKMATKNFYDRSDLLLFVLFSESMAYFVDIRKHKEIDVFSKREYLEIIERNWPELMEPHKINGMKIQQYTDNEIRQLRRKGYMTPPIEINSNTYFNPGFGMATSGTAVICTRRADSVVRYLHAVKQAFESNPGDVIARIFFGTGKKVYDLVPSIERIDNYPFFVVVEQNSGVRITE